MAGPIEHRDTARALRGTGLDPLTETQAALADALRQHDAYGPETLARALTSRFVIVERGSESAALIERARARR